MPRGDPDVFQMGRRFAEQLDALVHREQATLALVDHDGDDDLVELRRSPGDHIDMAIGHRVEGSRTHCSSHVAHAITVPIRRFRFVSRRTS